MYVPVESEREPRGRTRPPNVQKPDELITGVAWRNCDERTVISCERFPFEVPMPNLTCPKVCCLRVAVLIFRRWGRSNCDMLSAGSVWVPWIGIVSSRIMILRTRRCH